MSKELLSLLRSRRFTPLFLTQFLGAFNDNVYKQAMVILITYVLAEKTGMNGQILVTLAAGIFILPFFLFSATAGQLADKHEKSGMIRRIKLAEIILMSAGAIGFFMGSIGVLMVVLFLMGAQSAFFGPLKYSILPDHLRQDELIGGNAMIEASTFLAILIGMIVGGALILTQGGTVIISGIVIGMATLGWLASRAIPPAPAPAPTLTINWNIPQETWRIIGYARENRDVFLSIIGISWFWLVGATFLSQFPTFAKDVIGGDETVALLFFALFSVGIGIGSMVCNKLLAGEINGSFVPLGAIGMAVFTFLLYYASRDIVPSETLLTYKEFAASGQHWLLIAALLGVSISGGVYIVPLYAIMQSRSNPEFRSRVIGANNVMNALFMVVSAVFTVVMFELGSTVNHVFLVTAMVNFPVAWLVRKLVKQQQANNKNGSHDHAA